jgi:hypothetical protein
LTGKLLALERVSMSTTENEWHLPLRCPQCEGDGGIPFRVVSKTSGEVLVSLRCAKCTHEWLVHRGTPMFVPKPDRRRDPSSG